jgi:hypothetical protein
MVCLQNQWYYMDVFVTSARKRRVSETIVGKSLHELPYYKYEYSGSRLNCKFLLTIR